ncbi:MAG: GFA family protein [Burkholderiaceae bacterium]|nr:GFA family protein [Burkholderiaceae bacterium]
MTKYKGSCHCGAVQFEVKTNEPLDPYFRCNCSLCSRKGAVMGEAAREDLMVTQGEELISTYTWNTGEAQHYFCKVCGIYTHHVMRGATDRIGINMACVEGVDVYAVGEVQVGGGKNLSLVKAPRSAA